MLLLEYLFPVWLRNRLKSSGLKLLLSHTEKSCVASYYIQFYTNIKIKIQKFIPVLLIRTFWSFWLTKLVLSRLRWNKTRFEWKHLTFLAKMNTYTHIYAIVKIAFQFQTLLKDCINNYKKCSNSTGKPSLKHFNWRYINDSQISRSRNIMLFLLEVLSPRTISTIFWTRLTCRKKDFKTIRLNYVT